MAARASILVWLAVLSQLGLQPCLATRMGGGLAGASLRTKTKVSGQEADALSDLDADIADVSNRHLGIASSRSNSSTGKLKGKSNGTQAWWGRRRVSPTPAPSPEDTSTTTIESTSTSTTLPDTLPEEEDTTTTTTETTTSSTTLPDTLPEEEDTTTTTTETTTSSTTLPDTLPEEEGEAPGIDSKTEDTSSGGDSGSTTKTEGSGEDSSSGEDSGSTTKTEGSGEDSSSGGDSGSTTKTEGSGEDSSSGGDSGSTTKTEGSGEDSSSGGASGSTTKTEGSGEDSSSGGASGSSTKPEGSGEDSSSGGASGSTTKTEGSGEDSSSDTSSTTTSSTVTSKPTSRTPAPTPAPEGDEEIDGTITCTNRLYGGAVGAVLGGGVGYSLGSLGGVTAGVAAAVGIFPGALFTSMFSTFVVPEYRTVKCDDGYEPVEARIACYGSDKPRCRKKAEDSKNGGASASTSTPAPAAGGASGSTTKSKTEDSSSGGASGSTTKSESSGEDSSSGSAATDEDEMDMGAGEDVAMEEAAKHMPKMNEYTSDSIEDELDLRPENEVTRPEALPSRMENASTQQEGATRNANSVIEGLRDLGEEGIGNSSTEDNIEDDESTKAAEETGELDEEGEDAIEEIMNFRGNIDEYEEKDESTQASAATPPAAPPARPALLDTGVRRISPQTGQKAKKSKGKGRSGQNEDDNDDNMNSSAKESDEDDDEKDVHPEDLFEDGDMSKPVGGNESFVQKSESQDTDNSDVIEGWNEDDLDLHAEDSLVGENHHDSFAQQIEHYAKLRERQSSKESLGRSESDVIEGWNEDDLDLHAEDSLVGENEHDSFAQQFEHFAKLRERQSSKESRAKSESDVIEGWNEDDLDLHAEDSLVGENEHDSFAQQFEHFAKLRERQSSKESRAKSESDVIEGWNEDDLDLHAEDGLVGENEHDSFAQQIEHFDNSDVIEGWNEDDLDLHAEDSLVGENELDAQNSKGRSK
eukprot:TRINITY_DN483_c0_g1_i2.p1 TRINITY_DN483_c0_g1~~TRINITY_DN483_c0_g1_i2.p1  ORF type:complete len:978 (-),score=183.20 TRINITY_DN483_c0_g1_i2:216-3149(-)